MRKKERFLNHALLLTAMFSMLACYGPFRNTDEEEIAPPAAIVTQQPEIEPQGTGQEAPEPTTDSIHVEQSETTTPEIPGVNFEGIQFAYDASLAQQITPTIVEATQVSEEEGPWWENEPRHVRFDLQGYPLQDTFHGSYILVYPVEDFASMSEAGLKVVDLMKSTLADHSENPERLPFLPLFNAGALIRTQFKYLNFENGSGFRYVTQFGQATNEINNHELFYTFQGMTSDNQYYIAAVLPLSSPLLPDQSTLNNETYMQFEENFETYIRDLKVKMDAEAPEQFTPNLAKLDALFESMLVEQQ